uniref:Uncharacterized protein n=1 Tax=Arundo donax TaxID=35708 RepID=A0A0A8ZS94_ARUDO
MTTSTPSLERVSCTETH